MRAARFERFGGPEVLEVVEVPEPHAGLGQVRVAVRAAGLNPTELKARQGLLDDVLPQGTGRDVAGVVDEIGPGVIGVALGDRVFGFSDDGEGAAELALVSAFAPIPKALGFVDAAALPVVLETASRALDALGVEADEVLLVNGASGGIGATAVQLAAVRGARVVGVAGTGSLGAVRAMGAEALAYGPDLVRRVREIAPRIDRALDVAGSGVLPELIELTGGADRVVTVADVAGAQRHGVRFSTGAEGRRLDAIDGIGRLIAEGRFWLPVVRTFPLGAIADAHRFLEHGGVRGKVVLLVG